MGMKESDRVREIDALNAANSAAFQGSGGRGGGALDSEEEEGGELGGSGGGALDENKLQDSPPSLGGTTTTTHALDAALAFKLGNKGLYGAAVREILSLAASTQSTARENGDRATASTTASSLSSLLLKRTFEALLQATDASAVSGHSSATTFLFARSPRSHTLPFLIEHPHNPITPPTNLSRNAGLSVCGGV